MIGTATKQKRCRLVRKSNALLVCEDCGQRVQSMIGGPPVSVICRVDTGVAGQSLATSSLATSSPATVNTRRAPALTDDEWPKDAEGNAKPSTEWTSEDLPCIHRGAELKVDSCDVCGMVGQPFTRYACQLHGECSIIRRKKKGLRNCQHCPDRQPTAELAKRIGPIRVAFFSPGMLRGGAERWIVTLCKSWRGDVQATTVVLSDGAGSEPDIVEELRRCGVAVYGGPHVPHDAANSQDVSRFPTVIAAARKALQNADVVISWGWGGVSDILRDAGWHGPHIVVSHGACEWSIRLLDGPTRAATHVAAVSEFAAKAIPEEQRDRAKIMWNGIELDRIAPSRSRDEVRSAWGCGPDDVLIGYVGRLAVSKRPEAVAEAAAELQRRWPTRVVRPVLVGDGSHRDIVIPQCRELMGDALVLVPPPDHIGDAYGALDVMILASPSEGMSLALCEAWAAGVPTVATPVGAVNELERQFGSLTYRVLVGAGPSELADAVEAAMSGDRHTHTQQVAVREMTAARMARRWADWLREIAAG